MYFTISPQKTGGIFSRSVSDYVSYLEKENLEKTPHQKELFFNQESMDIPPEMVIMEIDGNGAKLKNTEPRFYSITINPSRMELEHLKNNPNFLKTYTQEVMKEYASAFNREINGRSINLRDIKYFAKVEYHRTYKGTDKEVKENAPYIKQIAAIEKDFKRIKSEGLNGNIYSLENKLAQLKKEAPHKVKDRLIVQGMPKPGMQTHVHIIVSRKDASNSYSLSPGSRYKSSEVLLHGKTVKRGFDRNAFYSKAEKKFDQMFKYERNYVESFEARKTLIKNPTAYYSNLSRLSVADKRIAFEILKQSGLSIPHLNLSPGQASFALKQIRKAIGAAIRASSIGY
jgi:hypothetical protein